MRSPMRMLSPLASGASEMLTAALTVIDCALAAIAVMLTLSKVPSAAGVVTPGVHGPLTAGPRPGPPVGGERGGDPGKFVPPPQAPAAAGPGRTIGCDPRPLGT